MRLDWGVALAEICRQANLNLGGRLLGTYAALAEVKGDHGYGYGYGYGYGCG